MMMRKFAAGLVVAGLLGSTSAMAAPVTPTVANVTLAPATANLAVGARLGAPSAARTSNIAQGAGIAMAVLAAAAVAGGVVAATDNGNGHSASP